MFTMISTEAPVNEANISFMPGGYPFDMVKLNINEEPVLPHYKAFKSFINPCILIIGVLFNSVFIFVSLRVKAIRTATNFYMINLAFADIFFLLFGIGEQMLRFHTAVPQERNHIHTSMFGSNGCDWFQLVTTTTHFATLFLFTLITVDRLYCVRNIRSVKLSSKRKHFLVGTALCWFVAVIIAITFLPSFKEVTHCALWGSSEDRPDCPSQIVLCTSQNPTWKLYRNVVKVCPFFLSVVLNFPLYAFLVKQLQRIYPTGSISSSSSHQNVKRITLTLILSGAIFFLCLLPYQFEVLYEELNRTMPGNSLLVFRSLALTLVYAHSALSPLLYIATSGRYRRAFSQATKLSTCRGTKSVGGSITLSNRGNRGLLLDTVETTYNNTRT